MYGGSNMWHPAGNPYLFDPTRHGGLYINPAAQERKAHAKAPSFENPSFDANPTFVGDGMNVAGGDADGDADGDDGSGDDEVVASQAAGEQKATHNAPLPAYGGDFVGQMPMNWNQALGSGLHGVSAPKKGSKKATSKAAAAEEKKKRLVHLDLLVRTHEIGCALQLPIPAGGRIKPGKLEGGARARAAVEFSVELEPGMLVVALSMLRKMLLDAIKQKALFRGIPKLMDKLVEASLEVCAPRCRRPYSPRLPHPARRRPPPRRPAAPPPRRPVAASHPPSLPPPISDLPSRGMGGELHEGPFVPVVASGPVNLCYGFTDETLCRSSPTTTTR